MKKIKILRHLGAEWPAHEEGDVLEVGKQVTPEIAEALIATGWLAEYLPDDSPTKAQVDGSIEKAEADMEAYRVKTSRTQEAEASADKAASQVKSALKAYR